MTVVGYRIVFINILQLLPESVFSGLTNPCCVSDGQQYEYGEDLGVTAVALYDYQAGETEGCFQTLRRSLSQFCTTIS